MPKPLTVPTFDLKVVSDGSIWNSGVYDKNGNHIGCVTRAVYTIDVDEPMFPTLTLTIKGNVAAEIHGELIPLDYKEKREAWNRLKREAPDSPGPHSA